MLIASIVSVPAIFIVSDWGWEEVRFEVQFKAEAECKFATSRRLPGYASAEHMEIARQDDITDPDWDSRVLPLRELDATTFHVTASDEGCAVGCSVWVNGEMALERSGTGTVVCAWPLANKP
jgi:hypothetical protein